ncbi:MAG: Stp1/IreP family PP2C-type Ser/Thr phosphatase [Christensenellales bacterium]|jgi:serine/threonine protein phosphatase PrpC
MIFAAKTDKGKVRERNEDYYHIPESDNDRIIAVADGLGGHNSGDLASSLAVLCSLAALERMDDVDSAPGMKLRRAIRIANNLVYNKAKESDELRGMGSTLTISLLSDNRAVIAHVGDSRAYLFRNGALKLITRDHSLFEEMAAKGEADRGCESHPARHILTRAVGTCPTIEVDTYLTLWGEGDSLLLCTDGLHGLVSEEEIAGVMSAGDIKQAAETLVEKALLAGGSDNITVVIASNTRGEGVPE